jgi:hypothetical protein
MHLRFTCDAWLPDPRLRGAVGLTSMSGGLNGSIERSRGWHPVIAGGGPAADMGGMWPVCRRAPMLRLQRFASRPELAGSGLAALEQAALGSCRPHRASRSAGIGP